MRLGLVADTVLHFVCVPVDVDPVEKRGVIADCADEAFICTVGVGEEVAREGVSLADIVLAVVVVQWVLIGDV